MSIGMGVMENIVHSESSKFGSLSNGNGNGNGGSEEKLGGNVLQNGSSYDTDSIPKLKLKRQKVFAVRDFPPGCGTIVTRLRSRTEAKNCQNGNAAADDLSGDGPVAENSGQRDEQQPCNDMEVESRGVNVDEPVKDESDELMYATEDENFSGNARDQLTAEPVEVQPLRVCLPDGNGEHFICASKGSVSEQSIATKQLHERSDVVNELPPKAGTKRSNSGKTVKVREKLDSGVGSSSRTQNMVRDMVVYEDKQSLVSDHSDQSLGKSITTNVPEPKPVHVAGKKKAKKGIALHAPLKLSKMSNREYGEGSSRMKNREKNLYLRERLSPDIENSFPDHPQTLQVGIPPSHPSGSSSGDSMRTKVKETLRLFHGACRKILQEEEAKQNGGSKRLRVDYVASNILKSKGKFLNTGVQIIGTVPGIEVGDEFQYRMELNILGIHKPSQGGIDYVKDGNDIIATSIVASGGYEDEVDNTGVLIYNGQGGNVIKVNKRGQEEKQPEDQQLITGNLALANSINRRNPVRVIRGSNKKASKKKGDARGKHYVYDGLYVVEEYWQETGPHGKNVFKYKLRRMPDQPELSWKVVTKTKMSKYREGLCRLDISEGNERLPICAVNEIDDEKPPTFIYTVKMIYPDWCRPIPPKACGCTKRCAEARNCACVAKNGGEIPYNHDGAIVDAKNLIYECGPLCKCPSSCYLRVTQKGIKFPLEIFKTESRGWGVRSLSSIPSGSFICEYVGELLEDKEAESRTGNDEYLFDIGNRYDNSLAEGMSELMPGTQSHQAMEEDEETSGFTIDAASKGNVGRFINHSCSPNLYAQNVLYDHEDTRIPHVMFFAMDNIPPLQELCYHYNYMIDQVRDSNGNIKKKICYCGSAECTGRLY